ncbi:HPP family protein [Ophiocordyceps camponoti-floridani]|uniref:HPP family protein n=1 Tax=Ophiocordyceps camponoti-floridani TaxID=2030778 RepID=A0A8H4Q8I8_9HYPO|nr:HPP family protein [Ophiocordyceps camponoti-floridani]
MGRRSWNWDLDRLINPLLPPPPWSRLPGWLSHFVGYRRTKTEPTGNVVVTFWAFVGVLASLLVISAVTTRVPLFEANGVPVIVGSFGAAAVLEFCTIESPLAQPRNAILGQIISAVAAIIVAKLFQLSNHFDQVRWVGGALACASATALMNLSGTVHPPAGATALLAVVDPRIVRLGWLLLPVIMLGCGLMLVLALLVDNIDRRFPLYWWTAQSLSCAKQNENQAECRCGSSSSSSSSGSSSNGGVDDDEETTIGSPPVIAHYDAILPDSRPEIVVGRGRILVPKHVILSVEEERLLHFMSQRL